MITTAEQAVLVQARRRAAGLKGRSKAVRRWFKREYGQAVEAHGHLPEVIVRFGKPHPETGARGAQKIGLRDALDGDFEGCRSFSEVHK